MPELPETSALLQVRVSADKSLMSSSCECCCSPVTSTVNYSSGNSQVLTLTSFICNSGSIGYSTQPVLVCSVLHLLPQFGVVFFARGKYELVLLMITGQWCSFTGRRLTVPLKASPSFSNP